MQQQRQQEQEKFNCTLCSVTKPIDQKEREKGKQKSSACKQCANNRLKERRQKSKNDEHLDMNVFVEVHFRDGA